MLGKETYRNDMFIIIGEKNTLFLFWTYRNRIFIIIDVLRKETYRNGMFIIIDVREGNFSGKNFIFIFTRRKTDLFFTRRKTDEE